MWYGILIGLLIATNWLWFVAFRAYRKEILAGIRKMGREKYQAVYMAEHTARLDEAQRKGHLKHNKHTAPIYHYNEDGSTVVLNEDRIEFLQSVVDKGLGGMQLDHLKPVSSTVNVTNGDAK